MTKILKKLTFILLLLPLFVFSQNYDVTPIFNKCNQIPFVYNQNENFSINGNFDIKIINVYGTTIYEKQHCANIENIDIKIPGVYFINIQTINEKIIKKIIVKIYEKIIIISFHDIIIRKPYGSKSTT